MRVSVSDSREKKYQKLLETLKACEGPWDLHSASVEKVILDLYQVEREHLYGSSFEFPNALWPSFDQQRGYAVRDALERLKGGESSLSYRQAIPVAGLIWRFSDIDDVLFKRIEDPSTAGARYPLEAIDTIFLYDALLLLACGHKWDPVARLAKLLSHRADLPDVLRAPVADFLFLASYHHYKINTAKSAPPRHILALEDSAVLAGAIAGPESRNSYVYRSIVHAMQGNMLQSEAILMEAVTRSGSLSKFLSGAETVFSREDIAFAKSVSFQPGRDFSPSGSSVEHQYRHDSTDQHVCFTAVDERYFNHFFGSYAHSYALKNPSGLLHLHCINFSPSEDAIGEIEKEIGLGINLSIEKVSDARMMQDIGGYCVTARYCYLPKILERCKSLYLSDVDGLIVRPVTDFWQDQQEGEKKDIILATRLDLDKAISCKPLWASISGGIVALYNTADQCRFARAMAFLMQRRLEQVRSLSSQKPLFFSDQTALAQLYLAFRHEMSFRRMRGPFFRQSPDVSGLNRLENKKAWAQKMLHTLRQDI